MAAAAAVAQRMLKGKKGGPDPDALTATQKLAALLIVLGEDIAAMMLKEFDDNEREVVCAEMAYLPLLDQLQQGEVLQGDRALAPGSGLAQRVVVIIVGDWIFDRGMPGRQIVSAKQAGMTTPAGVEDCGLCAEQIDRLGNKTPIPAFPGRLDLVFPGSAGVLRVTDQSTVCCGQLAVAK